MGLWQQPGTDPHNLTQMRVWGCHGSPGRGAGALALGPKLVEYGGAQSVAVPAAGMFWAEVMLHNSPLPRVEGAQALFATPRESQHTARWEQ